VQVEAPRARRRGNHHPRGMSTRATELVREWSRVAEGAHTRQLNRKLDTNHRSESMPTSHHNKSIERPCSPFGRPCEFCVLEGQPANDDVLEQYVKSNPSRQQRPDNVTIFERESTGRTDKPVPCMVSYSRSGGRSVVPSAWPRTFWTGY
jgi:hypothetical protein